MAHLRSQADKERRGGWRSYDHGVVLPRLSAAAYRRITLVALVALGVIVVTGAAVRLTGSGLGCSDWPACEPGRLAPRRADGAHALIEFVNRAITGVVSVAVVVAEHGSLLRRPRRRDLTWLSLGLVAGVVGQIVLGGLTVLFDLAPPLVMGHFLLSMVILADAVVLHHRAARPDEATGVRPAVGPTALTLLRCVTVVAAVVVFTGTVVTAAGPHAGDADVPRLDLAVPGVARAHGLAVFALLALTLAALWRMHRDRAPAGALDAGRVVVAVLVAQAGLGYTQYFTGVPAVLVGAHVLGAVLLWVAVIRLHLAAWTPRLPVGPPAEPDRVLRGRALVTP